MSTSSMNISTVLSHFKTHDPLLYTWAMRCDLQPIVAADNLFLRICDSIVSQQLSIKAADAILARFVSLFPHSLPTAPLILDLDPQVIRAVGISWAKVRSLVDLAEAIESGRLALSELPTLSDEAAMLALCQVKGIGPWTAEMILMFGLARTDLYSHGDLGLRKGMQKIYALPHLPTVEEADKITAVWSPYRTYGCRVLWRSLDLP